MNLKGNLFFPRAESSTERIILSFAHPETACRPAGPSGRAQEEGTCHSGKAPPTWEIQNKPLTFEFAAMIPRRHFCAGRLPLSVGLPPATLGRRTGGRTGCAGGDTLSGIARRFGVTVDALRHGKQSAWGPHSCRSSAGSYPACTANFFMKFVQANRSPSFARPLLHHGGGGGVGLPFAKPTG